MRALHLLAFVSLSSAFVLAQPLAGCGGTPTPANVPKGEATEAPKSGSSDLSFSTECVDPMSDGDSHDPMRPFDKHVQLDVRDYDLDDDGKVDIFAKPAWSCGYGCMRSAYVVRGTCGYYVGTFPSEDNYEMLPEKSNGLHDIKARPKQSNGTEVHCFQIILKYDGKKYQITKHRECECKEDSPKCEANWTDGADWHNWVQ